MVRILLMVAVLSAPSWAQEPWQSRTSIPTPRSRAGGAAFGGRLYVYGGYGATGTTTNAASVYDPLTNAWTPIPPMPTAKADMGSCEFNGRLFAISGAGSGGRAERPVFSYDPATLTWRNEPPVDFPRSGQAAATLGNRIYSLGGIDDNFGEPTNVVEVFDGTQWDSNTVSWYPEAPLGPFLGACGGRLYGGGGTWSTTVHEFDPASNSWNPVAETPTQLSFAAWAVRGSQLYVIGGGADIWGRPNPSAAAYVLDTRTFAWSSLTDLPSARLGSLGARIGRRLHVVGGEDLDSPALGLHDAIDVGLVGRLPDEPGQIGLMHGDRSPLKHGAWNRTRTLIVGANVSDPDNEDVSLEVKAWIDGTPEPEMPTASSAMGGGGTHEALMAGLSDGAYRLSVRTTDAEFNSSDWKPVGSDTDPIAFRIDGTAPGTPRIVAPIDGSNQTGDVRIEWTPASDANGPLVYHVRIFRERTSLSIIDRTTAELFMDEVLAIGVYRIEVRAEDPAGNLGPWSAQGRFHHDDGKDYGAGDGCSASIRGADGTTAFLLIFAALAVFRLGRRMPV